MRKPGKQTTSFSNDRKGRTELLLFADDRTAKADLPEDPPKTPEQKSKLGNGGVRAPSLSPRPPPPRAFHAAPGWPPPADAGPTPSD